MVELTYTEIEFINTEVYDINTEVYDINTEVQRGYNQKFIALKHRGTRKINQEETVVRFYQFLDRPLNRFFDCSN